jgi:hypothetical protein
VRIRVRADRLNAEGVETTIQPKIGSVRKVFGKVNRERRLPQLGSVAYSCFKRLFESFVARLFDCSTADVD